MSSGMVAWVESPLQLLGALEHAHAHGTAPTIVPRGGDAQLENTAAHLAARLGLDLGTTSEPAVARDSLARGTSAPDTAPQVTMAIDRRLMPARVFRADGNWLVGDAYSGQVQLRLDRAEPAVLTIVDDGAITRRLAEQLRSGEPLLRPHPPRRLVAFRRELATRTTRRLRDLAARGRLSVTTYLAEDDAAVAALRDLGVIVVSHRFDATRHHGQRAMAVPAGRRIVLGSAAVADRLSEPQVELARLSDLGSEAAIAYLPHRREPQWFLTAVSRLEGVAVVPARLPIELALAGSERSLEIIAPASTAAETLPLVLRGTGSVVRALPAASEVER